MDHSDHDDDSQTSGLKDRSLKAAGYAYLVGDASLFASGMMAGRHKEAASGLLWGIGGLACARYGNPNQEKQLRLLGQRLKTYLHKQGITIPNLPDTAFLARENGVIDQIESFLYAYPSQLLNTAFAIGGTTLAYSGLQNRKPWDAASGALITAGALAGLLIPEKKPDDHHPPKGMLDKTWAWIQEKPLRVSGIAFGINNVTLALSAFDEMRKNPAQKSYLFKYLTVASYIFANTMLGMSSKQHGNHDSGINPMALEKLSRASAQVIASQPPELQDALVQHISAFLSAQPEMKLKAEEISGMLQQKLAEIAPGKWQQLAQDSRSNSGSELPR